MPNLVAFPLMALCFLIPGYLWATVLAPSRNGLLRLILALSGGGILLGGLTMAWVQIGGIPADRSTIVVLAAAVCALLSPAAWSQRAALAFRTEPGDRIAIALAVTVGAFYLAHYDRSLFQFNCVNEASRLALVDTLTLDAREAGTGYLLNGNANVRLGNVALVAPSFAAFSFFGPRLLYAATFSLIFATGFAIGRCLFHRIGWAVATGVVLALNPYLGAIPLIDENLLSYAATALIVLALVDDDLPLAWLGPVVGMLLGFRHIALLAGGGIALLVWRRRPPVKDGLAGLAGLVAVCSLWAIHHHQVFGSVFAFESFAEYHADHTHRLLDMEFGFRGLMNYPLHDAWIRTPYNPYPTMVMVPLWFIDRFGVLGIALAIAGLHWLHRHGRVDAWFVLLTCLPLVGMVSLLESWMQPNKMGIPLTVLPPLVLAIPAGAYWLMERPKSRAAVLAALVGAVFGAQVAFASVDVPPDPRVHELEVAPIRLERPEYLAWERDHLVRYNLLPNMTRFAEYSAFAPARKLADVWFDLNHATTIHPPTRGQPTEPASDSTEWIHIAVDLGAPLVGRAAWADITTDPADLRVSPIASNNGVRLDVPPLPWTDQPAWFVLVPEPDQRRVHLVLDFTDRGLASDLLATFDAPSRVAVDRTQVVIAVPRGTTLRVTDVVADNFSRYYRWDIATDPWHAPTQPTIVFTN